MYKMLITIFSQMKRNVHMVNIVSVDNIFRQLVIIWSLSHLFPDGGSTQIIHEKASFGHGTSYK